MERQRDCIFSEDKGSILKRTKYGSYEIVSSFPKRLLQDFGIVDPQKDRDRLFEEEKEISSADPSFLEPHNQQPENGVPEESEEPSIKRKIVIVPRIPKRTIVNPIQLPPSPSLSTSSESTLLTPPSSKKLENSDGCPRSVAFSPNICGTPRPLAFSTPHQMVPSLQTQMSFYENKVLYFPRYVYPHTLTFSSFVYPSPNYQTFPSLSILHPHRFLKYGMLTAKCFQRNSELIEEPPKPPPRKASILESEKERGTLPKVLRKVHHVTLYETMRNKLTNDIQPNPERISNRAVGFKKLLELE